MILAWASPFNSYTCYSAGIEFRRQNQTLETLKTIPAL